MQFAFACSLLPLLGSLLTIIRRSGHAGSITGFSRMLHWEGQRRWVPRVLQGRTVLPLSKSPRALLKTTFPLNPHPLTTHVFNHVDSKTLRRAATTNAHMRPRVHGFSVANSFIDSLYLGLPEYRGFSKHRVADSRGPCPPEC